VLPEKQPGTISQGIFEKTPFLQWNHGNGSTFSFELLLPCEQVQPTNSLQGIAVNTTESISYKDKKVLIVEDNLVNMHYIQTAIGMFSKEIQIIKAED